MFAKDIFLLAIEIESAADRSAFVAEKCEGDVKLRRLVDALLAAHDDPDSYLERPAARFDITATTDGSGRDSGLSDSSSSHHGRFLPGTRIAGRYRIVSLLGRGGMGEVYRADDLRLGQTVALKFLPTELAKDAKRLEYFHNEVKLARQISHPNVCRVYDIGEVDGQHFISMEYIDGEDLKTLLHRIGRLPNDKGIQIAQQLCSGLSAAHNKGVLHRDLKPANIMIDGQGQVRITDFGLATMSADGENVIGMSGTPAYMSPEQILRGQTNIRSDIYSLGLVLYELFTGKRAFSASSLEDLRRQYTESSSPSDPTDVIHDLDPAIQSGIMRCLQSDPSQRPGSVDELSMWLPGGDALAAALAAGEIPSPDMVASAQEVRRFAPWQACAVGLAILAGIISVLWLSKYSVLVQQLVTVHSPAVLKNKSTEILNRFGYGEAIRDSASGFVSPQQLNAVNLTDLRLSNAYFEGVWFWFRTSPRFLTSIAPFDLKARVDESQPPWDATGMNGVRLDVAGNLRWFRHVSGGSSIAAPAGAEPRWTDWFDYETIGFDLGELTKVGAVDRPPDPYDELQAWEGKVDQLGMMRVTAAACDGKPSYFSVETSIPKVSTVIDPPKTALELTQLSVCLLALVFAYRNIRSGKVDRRGATTFATAIVIIELAGWTLGAHHSFGSHEVMVFWLAVANAIREGALGAVLYLAVEPLIRRTLPSTLTSFFRVLRGNWNDARVAQDVLIGTALGVWCAAVQLAIRSQWDMLFGIGMFGGAMGGRMLLADMTTILRESLLVSIGWPVPLLLLHKVVRSSHVAVTVWILVFSMLFGVIGQLPIHLWVLQVLVISAIAYVYVRHGILGNIALGFTFELLISNVTSNTLSSNLDSGFVGILVILLISGWALRNALRAPHVPLPLRPRLGAA